MDFAYGETVTIIRAPGVDQYGDPIPGDPMRIDIPGCAIAPRPLGETSERGRQGVIVGYTIYLPAGSPAILHTDQIEVRGAVREIDGEPAEWVSPFTGWTPGVEVAVKGGEG